MNIIGRVSVFPSLPQRIARLQELAYNLWWSWTPEAQALYEQIDVVLWNSVNRNPVRFLARVAQARLDAAAADPVYLARYDGLMKTFDAYIEEKDTWFARTYPELAGKTIAYMSMEFGLHEALPIYSGGLGVLSGDHCKEASDLGLPFVAMGFLYPQGYFRQYINRDGVQEAVYDKLNFAEVPALPVRDANGKDVIVHVELPGRAVYARVWKFQVGRIPIYLMDTDVEPNVESDRELLASLYRGDQEVRISQEIILGIGGVRALRAIGYDPFVYHMNEGHSAFLGLELIRELVQGKGLSFDEARDAVAASSVFTTHTPVPAGNDVFPLDLMDKYFWNYWPQLGLNRDQFMRLAWQDQSWGPTFSMTVLALRLSARANGVSKLHGAVARAMWNWMWPRVSVDEVPITSITNGIHTQTWVAPEMAHLYSEYLRGDWTQHIDDPATWSKVADIPDDVLWKTRQELRRQLVEAIRNRVREQRLRFGESPARVRAVDHLLDPNALLIGFARRVPTYKRATLLFRDLPRLVRLLSQAGRPAQIIFAGKAHPADEPGKALIQQIWKLSQTPELEGKIIYVEEYDMNLARYLVHGADVWLNNPRRPYEASGTSGQKAALNGCLNLSILDGWWPEAYNRRNGWAIGEERVYRDENTQDEADALSLYHLLEDEVIPMFYDRGDDGVPDEWLARVKNAISTVAPAFSMARMVKEYTTQMYMPGIQAHIEMSKDNYAHARAVAQWEGHIQQVWPQVSVKAQGVWDKQLTVGQHVDVTALANLADLGPDDVRVDIVAGQDKGDQITDLTVIPMQSDGSSDGWHQYKGTLAPTTLGTIVWGVRALPQHPDLLRGDQLNLVCWANT